MDTKAKIKKIASLLKRSKSILFITGAGISADSGLPTYRGIGGLYNDKSTDEGMPIEEALSGDTLETHPEITWKYLTQIEKNCRNAKHNRAHEIIAEIEKRFERVWVLTQNIDGFHRDAGSKNLIEIHGRMHSIYCKKCLWQLDLKDYSSIKIPPVCPECSSIARPKVVFFGEMLPYREMQILRRELDKGFDLYFTIGTTSVFPYIQEPIIIGNASGKPTIEINPSETEISDLVYIKLDLGAKDALELIWQEYLKA